MVFRVDFETRARPPRLESPFRPVAWLSADEVMIVVEVRVSTAFLL
jgi:hypothetical protein